MRSISLSTHQIFRATIMGVILWFFAALLLRYFGPMGAFESIARIVTHNPWDFAVRVSGQENSGLGQ
jgi:hypothetical protein